MKIVYIHQHFSTKKGATGTRSYEMSQRLLQAGHQVTLICGAYHHGNFQVGLKERIERQEVDGIDLIVINEPYANEMSFIQRLFAFGRFANEAKRIVKGLEADLVFCTSPPLSVGIPGMFASKRLGVPMVFEVRDRWPEGAIKIGVLKNPLLIWYATRLELKIYRAADRVIALSPGAADGIKSTGFPPDRVDMIPNGADIDLFQPSEKRLEDPRFGSPSDFKMVYTGVHGLANGLGAVLKAAAELKRRNVSGVKFIFIGQGMEKEQLMATTREEGLEELVCWIDPMPKDDLAEILPQMDAGLMILRNLPMYYYGSSPNKFFDYIASGLPVLNNYPGWVAGMIDDNKCGVVVPPDDPGAFADAVIWMKDHPEELKRMGAGGRQLAEREFARDLLGAQFVKALEQARENPKG